MAAHHTSGMSIDPWLPRAAAMRPGRVAIEAPEGSLTYAELLARAASDIAPGTRVALEGPPSLDFVVRLHAILLAGAVAVPVDHRLRTTNHQGVKSCNPASDAGLQDLTPVALVVLTSGTTGAPRPVEISHANFQANALASAVALGLDPDERWLCPLPLSHVGGLMVLLRSVIYATTAIIGPAERATHDDVTVVSLVPTQLRRLVEAGEQPGARLRVVLLGGAAATQDLVDRAREAGWPVRETYGLTQACSQVTVDG